MAGPLAGIQAAQVAQSAAQDPAAQAAKSGPSKFDNALKAKGLDHTELASKVQKANAPEGIAKAGEVGKADKVAMNKVNSSASTDVQNLDPVRQKAEVSKGTHMMASMMSSMEQGQASLDKLISGGLKGKAFSNTELLSLQAGMYKYTQELELTGKVVEKATSGLKDTLKTQV